MSEKSAIPAADRPVTIIGMESDGKATSADMKTGSIIDEYVKLTATVKLVSKNKISHRFGVGTRVWAASQHGNMVGEHKEGPAKALIVSAFFRITALVMQEFEYVRVTPEPQFSLIPTTSELMKTMNFKVNREGERKISLDKRVVTDKALDVVHIEHGDIIEYRSDAYVPYGASQDLKLYEIEDYLHKTNLPAEQKMRRIPTRSSVNAFIISCVPVYTVAVEQAVARGGYTVEDRHVCQQV